jgi:hypothetical protein
MRIFMVLASRSRSEAISLTAAYDRDASRAQQSITLRASIAE